MPTTWRAQPIGTTPECWYGLHPDLEQGWLNVGIGQTMSHASTAKSRSKACKTNTGHQCNSTQLVPSAFVSTPQHLPQNKHSMSGFA